MDIKEHLLNGSDGRTRLGRVRKTVTTFGTFLIKVLELADMSGLDRIVPG
jgi:hypothetical protein